MADGAGYEVGADYELTRGRRDYPANIAGAYHAVRLPILEYLNREHRQAGAIAFLEVYRDWVPLGVWRFRELARRALSGPVWKGARIEKALVEVWKRLEIPPADWLGADRLLGYYKRQSSLDRFSG